jgi:tetratricopeptide (TPR) repeat protein
MPKKIIISIIVVVVAAAISAGVWFWLNQYSGNNSEEAIPYSSEHNNEKEENNSEQAKFYTKHYNVDLINIENIQGTTPEMVQRYKDKFIEYQNKLEESVKNYEESGGKVEEKPNPDFFVEKARYAQYLEQTDWAIEILNKLFEYYKNSSVGWNNLAKLYESKGDYNKANEYYLKIIDAFGEKQYWGQYYYIVKNYMIIGDREKVREYYKKYKSFGGYDEEIEEYLAK